MQAINQEMHPIFLPNMTLHSICYIRQWTQSIESSGQVAIVLTKRPTETFSKEEENALRAVFWKWENVCLRGGSEHRDLRLSPIQQTENGCRYTENASKNRSGGLAQLHLKNKSIEIYRNPEAGDRCHCRILDLYISKLPSEAKDKDLFCVRPIKKPNSSTSTYERYKSEKINLHKILRLLL